MVPTRTPKSSSRQSSILKPPKPRHPLQNLNFNSSSTESSPSTTTKLKRRVSFAEKKHVKEFCNSLEQGTVWDNTYEEHDLSNLKVTSNADQEGYEVEEVTEESGIIKGQEDIVQFAGNNVIEKGINVNIVHDANTVEDVDHHEELIQDDTISPVELVMKKNRISHSIVIYKDEDDKVPEKISQLLESNENYYNYNTSNIESPEDTCMVFTEVVSNILCANENNIRNDDQVCKDVSMEFTQAVLSKPIFQNSILDQDKSMEFTQAVLSKPIFQNSIVDQDKSMELTQAVLSKPIFQNSILDQDKSMEFTQAVLSKPIFQNSIVDQDESMEFTQAVSSAIKFKNICSTEEAPCLLDEKTKKLDVSMEMTAAVSNIACNLPKNVNTMSCDRSEATVFHDISMEITKPVRTKVQELSERVAEETSQNTCNVIREDEKTKCLNMSMEITTPVPVNVHSVLKGQHNIAGGTNIADNVFKKLRYDGDIYDTLENLNKTRTAVDDMEFTVAVPTLKVGAFNTDLDNDSNEIEDRNTMFHNNSMTMTNVISTVGTDINRDSSQELERTMVFQSTSMEIREAIATPRSKSERENIVTKSNNTRQSMSPVNIVNQDLPKNTSTNTEIPPGNITISVASPTLKSAISDKENIDNHVTKESTPLEIRSSANTKTSITLHDPIELDTYASASKENNTETAAATFDTTNENKNVCLQNATSHSRRTYTVQPLLNDHNSSLINNKNNDTLLENENTCSMLLTKGVESLDSIKPPSFLYLSESSEADISINTSNNQEIIVEEQDEREKSKEKCIRKSQTYVISCTSPKDSQNNELLEEEVQVHINEVPKLDFLEARTTDAEAHYSEYLSSSTENIEKCSISDKGRSKPNLCLENSNLNNQSMELSSASIQAHVSDSVKTETCNELIDREMRDESNESSAKVKSERHSSCNTTSSEETSSLVLDHFTTLITELKIVSKSDEIIWEVYYENVQRNMFIIGFASCSLLVVIHLQDPCGLTSCQCLKEIKLISRLADDAEDLISMVHRLILEKLDSKKLLDMYGSSEDIFSLLDHISKEVKLAMDFMFELKRLIDVNFMKITRDSVSFISRTKRKDILVKISIEMKPFEKIESQNISVDCLLGSVREEDIKKLIINIKRDHKFLRRYIQDVKDYMYLMGEPWCD